MVGVLSNFVPSFVAAYNLYLELKHRAKVGDDEDGSKKELSRKESGDDKKDPPPNVLPQQAMGPLPPIIQIATQEPAACE